MLRRLLALVFLWTAVAAAAKGPIYIGLDAEFGHATSTSAQAIRQGMEIAMDEINRAGGLLGGRRLELVVRDNRSLPAVGVDHLRELAAVPDLVAVFGGRFSPVYIESLPVAHELGIPLMNPWGSADPITDHGLRPSFSFRLSLKDAWAAPAFVRFAREHHGATRLGVLLPNTAWGRSNQAAIMRAAAAGGASVVGERWYNWGDASLLDQYQELRLAGAQALILVANEGEGALLVREMAALPESESSAAGSKTISLDAPPIANTAPMPVSGTPPPAGSAISDAGRMVSKRCPPRSSVVKASSPGSTEPVWRIQSKESVRSA